MHAEGNQGSGEINTRGLDPASLRSSQEEPCRHLQLFVVFGCRVLGSVFPQISASISICVSHNVGSVESGKPGWRSASHILLECSTCRCTFMKSFSLMCASRGEDDWLRLQGSEARSGQDCGTLQQSCRSENERGGEFGVGQCAAAHARLATGSAHPPPTVFFSTQQGCQRGQGERGVLFGPPFFSPAPGLTGLLTSQFHLCETEQNHTSHSLRFCRPSCGRPSFLLFGLLVRVQHSLF